MQNACKATLSVHTYLKVLHVHVYLLISVHLLLILVQSGRGVGHTLISSCLYLLGSQDMTIQQELV